MTEIYNNILERIQRESINIKDVLEHNLAGKSIQITNELTDVDKKYVLLTFLVGEEFFSFSEFESNLNNLLNNENFLDFLINTPYKVRAISTDIINTFYNVDKVLSYGSIDNIKNEFTKIYQEIAKKYDIIKVENNIETDIFISTFNEIYGTNELTSDNVYQMFCRINNSQSLIEKKYLGLASYIYNYSKGLYTYEQSLIENLTLVGYFNNLFSVSTSDEIIEKENLFLKLRTFLSEVLYEMSKRTINY